MMSRDVEPVIKWVGGKTQIIERIIELFPDRMETYYEPFVGGGSVLIGLLTYEIAVGNIVATDKCAPLIAFYKDVQHRPERLIKEVGTLITEFNGIEGNVINRRPKTLDEAMSSRESYYYWCRAKFNEIRRSIRRSALFLFLNKTSFRGLYRTGPNGFNVPFGHYANPKIMDADNLRAFSKLVRDVEFKCCDYGDTLARVEDDDFVYLDPPYAPVKKTSFVDYNSGGFGAAECKQLFARIKELPSRFLMSNADVPSVVDEFGDGYVVDTITCRRAINSRAPASVASEVLIRNY